MNFLGKSVLTVFAFSFVAFGQSGPSGTDLASTIQIAGGTTFSYFVDYVNFSSVVTADAGDGTGNTISRSFYNSWTPDTRGTRPYKVIMVANTSTTQNLSFFVRAIEPINRTNYSESDSRLWAGGVGKYHEAISWYNVDDDHSSANFGFGAKITLAPTQGINLIVSMYSSSTSKPWFGVHMYNNGEYGLDTNYPEVIVNADGSVTKLRVN